MKNPVTMIFMFIMLALLIPASLSGAFAFLVAALWADETFVSPSGLLALFFLSFLCITYTVSYIIGLVQTIRKRALTFISFLPLIHFGLFFVLHILFAVLNSAF